MRKSVLLGALVFSMVGACASTDQADIPPDLLVSGESFVSVAKPTSPDVAAVRKKELGVYATSSFLNPGNGDDFYIAINKKELGKEWFLSGYLRQYYPGAPVDMGAARSLGTRVVSFKVQNGKLFVFDVAKNKISSDLFNPEILVEAYPIVKGYAPFEGLANSSQYVLFDPSAGLNKFGAGNESFYDFYLSMADSATFTIGVSFLRGFRKLSDGVTFQQIFTGQGTIPTETGDFNYRASGTLGVALRRYSEGEGYEPTPLPWNPHYFQSDYVLDPDRGGVDVTAVHWNIKRDGKPVKFLIGRQILEYQKQFPTSDVVGAVKRGVENWNQAFGFKALEAEIAGERDDFAEDDKNFIIVDTQYTGYAFANWRTNPNSGEIRGASVYLAADWFFGPDYFKEEGGDTDEDQLKGPAPAAPPASVALRWGPMHQDPLCKYFTPQVRREGRNLRVAADAADTAAPELTPDQKFEKYLTHVVLHEVGHTLGLRHNFMGSLANNSVMDYLLDDDSIARDTPGEYDIEAIKYLYQLSSREPQTAFCTDGDYRYDPDCAPFDVGADPLHDDYKPTYDYLVELVLEIGWGFGLLDYFIDVYMNEVLKYARAAYDTDIALEAYRAALGPSRAPVSSETLAMPEGAAAVDGLSMRVLKRLYLDPPDWRGYITNDPPASVVRESLQDIRANLTNGDKLRSFENRRAMVDILKKMQSDEAYAILVESRASIQAALSLGGMSAQEVRDTNDLLARIDQATRPYWNN
jgi:hypothetical protein